MLSVARRGAATFVVALLLFGYSAMAQTAPTPSVDARRGEIEQAIKAAMERHDVPGVSVAVIDDYQIAWAEGFGWRASTHDGGVRPTTRFQAASISKPVTALAVLRCVEQGRLDLNEDVNKRLKSWRIPDSPLMRDRPPVMLRHLLSHTAGLSVHGFEGYAANTQVPSLLQVLDGSPPANSRPIRVDVKPGYMFRYSGGGYCVVQQLLGDVTGQPFPEFMHAQVLEPLGMTHSTYEQPLSGALVDEAAFGHRAKKVLIPGNYHVYPEMSAAGLWTTPSDLARVVIDLAKSVEGGKGKLLSQGMANEMLKAQKGRLGLGVFVQGEGDKLSFSHGGANEGYRCHMVGYPATGQGFVIMTNSDTGGELIKEVSQLVAKTYAWP